eukprot:Protomagalhaensia_wolfi_Nauph_80__2019@NODE_2281_length_1140_cov_6530_689373_g1784_i0_p1_GENE_NODE_2281_length_1140_cov_6530_689373_g1784_i0NODE_2281_length_1140_cov_6530_689373_g1784_i0_p1_ORF_typecomplete_len305_score58_31PYRIN/PF02758_16/0_32_NODE_2281_length_1140_cov_6530_689373_g1784_i01231037
MKLYTVWSAFFAFVASDDIHVLCESGTVDEGNLLSEVTDATCKAECQAKCAGDLDDDKLDDCLSQGSLLGCLFTVQKARSVDLNHCSTTDSKSTVTLVRGATLSQMGDGSPVQTAILEVDLSDGADLTGCPAQASVGISTTAFDEASCVAGTGGTSVTWTRHDGDKLHLDVTSLMKEKYSEKAAVDVPVFINWQCPVAVDGVDMTFTLTYKDGYRPNQACRDTEGCEACVANGCVYCDYTHLTNLIPDWMPSFITQLKGDEKGVCGLNTALCRTSAGRVSTCGGAKTITVASLVFAVFTIISQF